jgi:hypothetical protein
VAGRLRMEPALLRNLISHPVYGPLDGYRWNVLYGARRCEAHGTNSGARIRYLFLIYSRETAESLTGWNGNFWSFASLHSVSCNLHV